MPQCHVIYTSIQGDDNALWMLTELPPVDELFACRRHVTLQSGTAPLLGSLALRGLGGNRSQRFIPDELRVFRNPACINYLCVPM